MFSVRLIEHPLPTTERDVDGLIAWLIDTLALVRKRGEATADHGRAGSVHRLLRDHLIGRPEQSWDCLLYTSPSPRDKRQSRMPSSA